MYDAPIMPPSVSRRALMALALLPGWPLAARAASLVKPWPAGQRVPPLALDDLEGRSIRLADLRGKVVVANFWATWCEPCRAEMPSLAALSRQHPADALVVLAVNYQESEPRIRRFMEAVPMPFPVLLDRDGAAGRAWTRRIFPTTVLIDGTGRPRHVVTGEYDWAGADAARLIEPLLRTATRP